MTHPGELALLVMNWQPSSYFERILFTTGINVSVAIFFGILLAAGFSVRGKTSPTQGAVWGLWAYASFYIAPVMGLPLEFAGSWSADLIDRQIWCLMTALFSSLGVAMLAFWKKHWLMIIGSFLIVFPHVNGSNHSDVYSYLSTEQLAERFITSRSMANIAFWVVLGGMSAWSLNYSQPSEKRPSRLAHSRSSKNLRK